MLTSRDNPMVKLCRRLQTGAKARREEGLFLAEGVRLCREALSAGEVRSILATQAALDQNPWLGQAGEVVVLSPGVAQAISDTKTPQGVFCLCALPKEREPVIERWLVCSGNRKRRNPNGKRLLKNLNHSSLLLTKNIFKGWNIKLLWGKNQNTLP